jgi:ABC-type nitrate/sulfonate/bicarbonate transport system ATPase subunit
MSKSLEIDVVQKEFNLHGLPRQILGEIEFRVASGELVSLLGPSGCGKTTILRLVLGLDNHYQGKITLGSVPVVGPGLDRGVVFQEPRLIPWMTVRKNVEFAIPEEADRKLAFAHVDDLLDVIGLAEFGGAYPNQLSGGMAQRVALARALVNVPDLLLLDEPFGALDSHTRMAMQEELVRVLSREGTTTLMVTHDVDEAVFLSDEIIVLTRQPARIRARFRVHLDSPRDRTNPGFTNLRNEVLKAFYG